MLIDKKEYIVRQISKTRNKRYENYIVCRIINLLDDLSVKFITQQPVIRSDGRRSLTDLYFPQLDLHVEVDELYHKRQIEADIDREADIINITGHKIERIDASKNIKEIHKQIDRIVGDINEMVQRKSFIP
jgi:very-short-patch-repair endonuclease